LSVNATWLNHIFLQTMKVFMDISRRIWVNGLMGSAVNAKAKAGALVLVQIFLQATLNFISSFYLVFCHYGLSNNGCTYCMWTRKSTEKRGCQRKKTIFRKKNYYFLNNYFLKGNNLGHSLFSGRIHPPRQSMSNHSWRILQSRRWPRRKRYRETKGNHHENTEV
jgi:hypothetical protein